MQLPSSLLPSLLPLPFPNIRDFKIDSRRVLDSLAPLQNNILGRTRKAFFCNEHFFDVFLIVRRDSCEQLLDTANENKCW